MTVVEFDSLKPGRSRSSSVEDAFSEPIFTTNFDSFIEDSLDRPSVPVAEEPRVDAEFIEDLPAGLVEAYARLAVQHSIVREVDPGVWLAEVVALEGAMASGGTPQEAEEALPETIVGWVAVKRRLRAHIPPMEGLDLNI